MKKRSSREASFFASIFFSRFLRFFRKKTKHLLLASFFSGRSAAQNDEIDDDVMSCIFLSTLL